MLHFNYELKVRINDINFGNHLGHTQLINLLHEVRVNFLNLYGISETNVLGHALIVHQLSITYKNEAFWNDNLNIELTCRCLGAKIFFNYIVHNKTRHNETARGEIIMVLIDNHKKIIKANNFLKIIQHR